MRVQEYDGLRAIAVLLVFCYHFNEDFFYFGWVGVDVFFAISGFVITLQCLTFKQEMTGKQAVWEFFLRRTTRIFPLYYSLLLMFFITAQLVTAIDGVPEAVKNISDVALANTLWKNALYLTNFEIFFEGYSSVAYGITWSLAVEEHFYLLYPFVFFFVRNNKLIMLLAGVVLFTVVLRTWLALTWELPGRMYYLTFTRIDALLVGCIAGYQYYSSKGSIPFIRTIAVTALTIGIVLLANYAHNDLPMIIVGYFVIPLGIAATMYWIADRKPTFFRIALTNKPMVFIGSISYGIYLFHIFVVNGFEVIGAHEYMNKAFGGILGNILLFSFELGLTVFIAWTSFTKFETPARQFLTRLIRSRFKSHKTTSISGTQNK